MKKEFLDKIDQYPIPSFKEICRDIYQNSTPFPHIRLENLFSTDLMENIVENVYNIKDEYKWNKLCTKGNDFSQFGKAAEVLTRYLVSDEWVNFVSELTGIDNLYADKSWYASGINVEPRGSHLEPHTDFNFREGISWRMVNFLLFLSKDWKKKWGGQNELGHQNPVYFKKDIKTLFGGEYVCDKKYNPDFNTAVIFSTSDISYHGFGIVRCPEDQDRIVITSYYYSKDNGPHLDVHHTTKYIGWDKRRKQKEDYEKRRGTGFKELE